MKIEKIVTGSVATIGIAFALFLAIHGTPAEADGTCGQMVKSNPLVLKSQV